MGILYQRAPLTCYDRTHYWLHVNWLPTVAGSYWSSWYLWKNEEEVGLCWYGPVVVFRSWILHVEIWIATLRLGQVARGSRSSASSHLRWELPYLSMLVVTIKSILKEKVTQWLTMSSACLTQLWRTAACLWPGFREACQPVLLCIARWNDYPAPKQTPAWENKHL